MIIIRIYRLRNEAFHINKRGVNYFLDFSFLCRPIWGNATVSAFRHILIVGRWGTAFPQQIIGGTRGNAVPQIIAAFPLYYTTGSG